MGGCQNYGPFLGTPNIRCRIIIGIQKRDHNFDNHPYPKPLSLNGVWGLGGFGFSCLVAASKAWRCLGHVTLPSRSRFRAKDSEFRVE